jgi:predicted nucleotidyltransferase
VRSIDTLDSLNIPGRYKEYLVEYLDNISDVPYIHTVYLFGSCAAENVQKGSDIDLFITTSREITDEEDWDLAVQRLPEYSAKTIQMDVIIQPDNKFQEFIDTFGILQRQVYMKGINLNGLLSKRG